MTTEELVKLGEPLVRRLFPRGNDHVYSTEFRIAESNWWRDAAAALAKRLAATERELERWRHGETIESDFICPNELTVYELTKRLAESDAAFDVMIRRKWWPVPITQMSAGWCVNGEEALPWVDKDGLIQEGFIWPDPFTALVDAEAWYVANVENKK